MGKVKYQLYTINFLEFVIHNVIFIKYRQPIKPNTMRLSADRASQHQRLFDKTTLSQTR